MEERRYLKLWAIRLKKLVSEFFLIFNSELVLNHAKTKGKHETFFFLKECEKLISKALSSKL